MLAGDPDVALDNLNGRREVLAHQLGGEACPGGELPYIYGLAPGVYERDETVPV